MGVSPEKDSGLEGEVQPLGVGVRSGGESPSPKGVVLAQKGEVLRDHVMGALGLYAD